MSQFVFLWKFAAHRSTIVVHELEEIAMMGWLRRHKVAVVVPIAVLVFPVAWGFGPFLSGAVAARIDIARGHQRILDDAVTAPFYPIYVRLLKERYGIEGTRVARTGSRWKERYLSGYNYVSFGAALRHFRKDVFAECAGDASQEWENSLPPMERMFPYAAKKTTTTDCFRSFSRRTSVYQVVQACGRPDDDPCSGLYCFVWHLEDGNTIWLGTPYMERIDRLSVTDKSGKQSSLLRKGN